MTRRQTAIVVVAGILVALAVAWVFLSSSDDGGPARDGERAEIEVGDGEALTLLLYFPGDEGWLVAEERVIQSAGGAALLRAVTVEVLAGPVGANLFAPFLEGTEAGNTFISASGIAYVDLVSIRPNPPSSGSRAEMLSVYSVVNTLQANLPELTAVVLLWNGQQRPSFAGHLDTGRPLTTNDSLVVEPSPLPGG